MPADPFRPARWVDAVGRARGRVSRRSPVRLDAEDLHRRAEKRLGRRVELNDPGLHVLLAGPAIADLTDLGRLAVRASCTSSWRATRRRSRRRSGSCSSPCRRRRAGWTAACARRGRD